VKGAQCLTAHARWLAWVEREAARENGLIHVDPTDVRPPMPLHGHHSHAAEALTTNANCFCLVGISYASHLIHEARHRISCLDTHRHMCKHDGKYDLEVLRRIAVERGVLSAKLKKTAESSDKVVVMYVLSHIVRWILFTCLFRVFRLQESLPQLVL
jgi:hypothetical protein